MGNFTIPGYVKLALVLVVAFIIGNGAVYKSEAGYVYHVRTITGSEHVDTGTGGYKYQGWGRVTEWKQGLTVQSVQAKDDDDIHTTSDGATIEAFRVTFLGNVDANIEATARFRIPIDDASFLKLAHEYRTPENFISTALVPALKDTLQSTASLMTADEFYAGARSEFSSNFAEQLGKGTFIVTRQEVRTNTDAAPAATAIAQQGVEQGQFGDNSRTTYKIVRQRDAAGNPRVMAQKFLEYGVSLIEARVTNVIPNGAFQERMVAVQKSSADLAIKRQDRLKEEEAKLLAIAVGEREVEQQRQATLKDQVTRTTNAETDKQLALVEASKQKEQAAIAKETSQILLEQAKLDAERTRTLADAEAFAKQAALEADNGLQTKLNAWVQINQAWAQASATAAVPGVVMGGANGSTTSRQDEFGNFMGLLAAKAAKDLDADIKIAKGQ